MDKAVYTLRYLVTDGLHHAGERLVVAAPEVNIGHTEGCEVRMANASPYADEVLAAIRQVKPEPDADGEGPRWVLVRLSPFHELRVNGMPVHLLHELHDGDRIEWADQRQAFRFVEGDSGMDVMQGRIAAVPRSLGKRMALWASIPMVVMALAGMLVWWWYEDQMPKGMTAQQVEQTRQSVLQINVDTVKLVRITDGDTTVMESVALGEGGARPIVGTAFLTTDSLLVTARHCLEPWLNDAEVLVKDDPRKVHFLPSRWALRAETYNQLNGEQAADHLQVVSVCSLWKYEGEQATFVGRVSSSEFVMDTSRDDIVDLGDYSTELYWRSITRRHQRSDMMRDDLAVRRWTKAGTIRMATAGELAECLKGDGAVLEFFGFPDYTDLHLEHTTDRLRRPLHKADDDTTLFDMLAHNGDLRHGYSGGPVMTRWGNEAVCVGIVSVTDARGADRFYSVPATEVWHLKKQFKISAHELH